MKIIFILQARVNSERLKGKSIIPLYESKPSLDLIINKINKIKKIHKSYIASGPKSLNMQIYKKFKNKSVNLFFGSEKNVRKRFEIILKNENPDLIIRATGDNPLVDVKLIKYLIKYIKVNKRCSYVKFEDQHIPFGSGVEVFRKNFFFKHLKSDSSYFAKEHVTVHMMNKKGAKYLKPPRNLSKIPIRLTIDNAEDLKFIRYIYSKIKNPNILKIDEYFKRLIDKR